MKDKNEDFCTKNERLLDFNIFVLECFTILFTIIVISGIYLFIKSKF